MQLWNFYIESTEMSIYSNTLQNFLTTIEKLKQKYQNKEAKCQNQLMSHDDFLSAP